MIKHHKFLQDVTGKFMRLEGRGEERQSRKCCQHGVNNIKKGGDINLARANMIKKKDHKPPKQARPIFHYVKCLKVYGKVN